MWTRRLAVLLVLAVPLGGCGGPSAEERAETRAAADGWSKEARASCEILGAEILSRAGAGDVEDIERYGGDVARLLGESVAELERIPVPDGAEARARPVLDAVHGSQARLRELRDATRGDDLGRIVAAADGFASRLREIDPVVERAGLRSCWGAGVGERVRRGLRSPIVAKGLKEIRREYTRSLAQLEKSARDAGLSGLRSALRDHAAMLRRTPEQLRRMPVEGVLDDTGLRRLSGQVARVADRTAATLPAARGALEATLARLARVSLRFETELDRLEHLVL